MANATVTVLEADGSTQTDVVVLDVGRQAAAESKSTAMSTEDKAQLDALVTSAQLTDNIVLAEDAAHVSGDPGVQMLAVRKDTSSTGIGANGDYVPLAVNASGMLYATIDPAQVSTLDEKVASSSISVVHATNRENSVAFPIALSTDTSAYASGDLIADTQQMDAFFNKADGCGVINSITIIDKDAQGAAFYILFHSTSTSMGTENGAPNISDANALGIQGIVAVATSDYVTVSGTKVACIRNIGLPVKAVSGTDDLYVSVLNATGTPTYTATGLNLIVGGLLD